MDFNYGEIIDKMTNCCDEISDPTPILVASRIAQDHDPIEAGSFVESHRIEKSWADEKLVIRSLFHNDRIVSGIGPCVSISSSAVSSQKKLASGSIHDRSSHCRSLAKTVTVAWLLALVAQLLIRFRLAKWLENFRQQVFLSCTLGCKSTIPDRDIVCVVWHLA